MARADEELRTVTTAGHQAEAEMVQGMLREEGIESMVRRARTFDLPHFGAGAPHEVLVLESDYERAHELVHGRPLD
jgi:Putative prokaryotic signal transducing protein